MTTAISGRNLPGRMCVAMCAGLLLASTCAAAQEITGTITFHGTLVEPTRPLDSRPADWASTGEAPHRITLQALDAMPAKGEFLEYFVDCYREAGITSDRLRLATVDYF